MIEEFCCIWGDFDAVFSNAIDAVIVVFFRDICEFGGEASSAFCTF